jgi:hypothetical protein
VSLGPHRLPRGEALGHPTQSPRLGWVGALALGLILLSSGSLAQAEGARRGDQSSQEVPLSPEEEATLEGPGPVEVRPGPRAGSVRLRFPDHPGALGYEVERSGWDEGPWEEAASGSATVLVVGGLKSRTHYCFRVAARLAQGRGPFGVPGCGLSR